MLVVIGLGNPGPRYAHTRHNAGFMIVEELARRGAARFAPHEPTCSELAQVRLQQGDVWLAKPQTYMNRSGESAAALLHHLGCEPGDVLVVLDDALLDFCRLRFRRGGSDGGHNGLASVLEALHTRAVARLRLGVGMPPPGADMIDYVLSDFGAEDDSEAMANRGAEAVEFYAATGMEAAMNRFNGL